MRHRILPLLVVISLSPPLNAYQAGEVYFDTAEQVRVYHEAWEYAAFAGGCLLIYKCPPIYGRGHYIAPSPHRFLFHRGRTVSAWDGGSRYANEPGKGYDDIFTSDAELSEIALGRAGRYLVAERWSDPARGARLIEFDLSGRVAEHRFPDVIARDRALGATHIELLADQCTVLYTLGHDDPAGARIRRLSLCTNQRQPDFATLIPGQYAGAIRQLPDGDVLVANGSAIFRFTSTGSLVLAYPVGGARYLALSSDARSFWVGSVILEKGELRRFDLDWNWRSIRLGNPGNDEPPRMSDDVDDLVVVGEWRSAAVRRPRAVRRAADPPHCETSSVFAGEAFYADRYEPEREFSGILERRDVGSTPNGREHQYFLHGIPVYSGGVLTEQIFAAAAGSFVTITGKIVDIGYGREIWAAKIFSCR